MKLTKKLTALVTAGILSISLLAGCSGNSGSKVEEPKTKSASMEEMVSWMTSKGFIEEGTEPVDINTNEGYVTDNTGGQMPVAVLADTASDYNGLWLFYWDLSNEEGENYEIYQSMIFNDGFIVYMGGAAVLETAAVNGAFAIAFAEDYAKKDDALAAFEALKEE